MHTTKENFFWLLVLLYMVNDLLYMASDNYLVVMAVDYSIRIITLMTLFMLYKNYVLTKYTFYLHPYPYKKALFLGVALALFGVILFRLIEVNLTMINIYEGYSFPEIKNPWLYWFDMSVGLVLVSFSEELLFHAYFYTIYKSRFSTIGLVLFSSLLFAAIHWSNDLTNILGVFIWGVATMGLLIKTQSLWPLLIGHTLVNFVLFLEILPNGWFRF